jgi:hypothetical protein
MLVVVRGVCVVGDFNAIRLVEEKSRGTIDGVDDFFGFNQFIDVCCLIDLPICARRFIWYHGDELSMR